MLLQHNTYYDPLKTIHLITKFGISIAFIIPLLPLRHIPSTLLPPIRVIPIRTWYAQLTVRVSLVTLVLWVTLLLALVCIVFFFTFQADIPLVIGPSDTVGNFSLRVNYDTAGCPISPCQAVDPIVYLREAVFNDGGAWSCWPYKSFLYIDSSSKITYWAIVEYGGRSLNMTCSSSSGSTCVLSPTFKFASESCSWTITLSIISSTVLPFGIPTPSLPVPLNPVPLNPVPGPGLVSNLPNGTDLTPTNNDKSISYIVGGVIGGIVLVGLVSLLAGYWYYQNRKKEDVIPDIRTEVTLDTNKDHKP